MNKPLNPMNTMSNTLHWPDFVLVTLHTTLVGPDVWMSSVYSAESIEATTAPLDNLLTHGLTIEAAAAELTRALASEGYTLINLDIEQDSPIGPNGAAAFFRGTAN